jgi:hypothetical protein
MINKRTKSATDEITELEVENMIPSKKPTKTNGYRVFCDEKMDKYKLDNPGLEINRLLALMAGDWYVFTDTEKKSYKNSANEDYEKCLCKFKNGFDETKKRFRNEFEEIREIDEEIKCLQIKRFELIQIIPEIIRPFR